MPRPRHLDVACLALISFGAITVATRAWGLAVAWNDAVTAIVMIEGSIIGVGLLAATASHWMQRSRRANRFLQGFVVIAILDALIWGALMVYAMFFEDTGGHGSIRAGIWVLGSFRITWSVFKIITLGFCLWGLRSQTVQRWLDAEPPPTGALGASG